MTEEEIEAQFVDVEPAKEASLYFRFPGTGESGEPDEVEFAPERDEDSSGVADEG